MRVGIFGAASVIFIFLAYQWISEKIDSQNYPPPGEMVDIGGYKLHLNKMGKGRPTVVLDAGLGCCSLEWSLIQKEIAKFTTAYSYDRAGYGWSEKSPLERTSKNIVQELHTLLHKAQVPSPYIFVGHSFGGVNARLYVSTFPEEVAAIVLVDAAHEDQLETFPMPNRNKAATKLLAYLGLARLISAPRYNEIRPPRFGNIFLEFPESVQKSLMLFPEEIQKMYIAKCSTTNFVEAVLEESEMLGKSLAQLKKAKKFSPEKPFFVITAEKMPQQWHGFQKKLVALSPRAKQIIAKGSDHLITRGRPDIIIDAVKEITKEHEAIQVKAFTWAAS